MNTYGYVAANPLSYIDPFGLAIGDFPPPPPGYDPKTWKTGIWDNGKYYVKDPNGKVFTVHPEDKGHWRHWDDDDNNRWPPNSKKTWPNQKKPPKADQCADDPNGDAPPWSPADPQEFSYLNEEDNPVFHDPANPFSNPSWGTGRRTSPNRLPIRLPGFAL